MGPALREAVLSGPDLYVMLHCFSLSLSLDVFLSMHFSAHFYCIACLHAFPSYYVFVDVSSVVLDYAFTYGL